VRPRRARAIHEFFFENLRNPARNRRAGLMRQFCTGQVYSILVDLGDFGQIPGPKFRSKLVLHYSGGVLLLLLLRFPRIIIFCALNYLCTVN
jgi:hypothetical protein